MSRKHFSWLLFLTFLVAAAVLMTPQRAGRDGPATAEALVPGLEAKVNQVSGLKVTGAGNRPVATLRRSEQAWVVVEADGYRADWERVRRLLSDLAQARVLEAKTDNPAYYGRLGVEDVGAQDAAGLLIEFEGEAGLPAVIIGNAAQSRSGQYVRLSDSAVSALADRSFDVPAERRDWLDTDVVDIGDGGVLELSIVHADGESVRIQRASVNEENFTLLDIPEGREIRSAWNVNAPANGLASLKLDDVRPDSEMDWSGALRFTLTTEGGLQIEVDGVTIPGQAGDDGAEHWLRLRANLFTTAVDPGTGQVGDEDAAVARAAEINQRVSGWAYRVPSYKYETLSRRMEDLLKTESP
jgi:hypothetical protein